MTRRKLSAANKLAILERQAWTCGCGKGCNLRGEYVEYDHMLPLALGGADTLENMQALLADCHRKVKTPDDIRRIRKADRQRKHHETGRSRARKGKPMQGRGFDTRFSRRMNGEIVERRS